MQNDPSIAPGIRRTEVAPVQAPSGARPSEAAVQRASFEDLLERLQSQAVQLNRASEAQLDARSLHAAVNEARESLSGALELSESLLEAYRAAAQVDNPEDDR